MENRFRNICGKINYNTYDDIEKIVFFTAFGISIANEIMLKDSIFAMNYVDYIIGAIISPGVILSAKNFKVYTKDITEIRKLYNEFIKRYNKINKIFDLNNLEQMNIMFNYLLKKGYLSYNKNYEFSDKKTKELKEISGANIIVGKGVCRHVASMFSDILNDYGIESNVLVVYLRDYEYKIDYVETPKLSKEEILNRIKNIDNIENIYNETLEKTIDLLSNIPGKKAEVHLELEKENIFLKLIGNHAITYAFKDGKSYFLDPTQNRIYRIKDNKTLYDESGEATIKLEPSILHNEFERFLNLRKRLNQPECTEKEKYLYLKTLEMCEKNRDIFEKFYKENNELYHEISDKMSSVRKSLFIR